MPSQAASASRKPRDVRLDFFRGLSLAAIFVAHVPGTVLFDWIWARYGFSDAAHVFVFISGYAAAMAFGGTFLRQGFAIGAARVGWRVAQLYGAHLALFLVGAALCGWAATRLGVDYAAHLGIGDFFVDPAGTLVDLLTLRYVPSYFNILPLYMLVLAAVPVAMLLARIHTLLPIVVSAAIWAGIQITGFNLGAGTSDGAVWGFNPLAWQLIFFTGFSLARGWFAPPRVGRPLFLACLLYLAVAFIAVTPLVYSGIAAFETLHDWALAHAHKPNLDLRQYLHFLALAAVVLTLLAGREQILLARIWQPLVTMGRQALPVFFASLALSHLGGILLMAWGTGFWMQVAVNGAGLLGLYAVARGSVWIKAAPWKTGRAPETAGQSRPAGNALPAQLATVAG